jgi:hypothetical protein
VNGLRAIFILNTLNKLKNFTENTNIYFRPLIYYLIQLYNLISLPFQYHIIVVIHTY